MGYYYRGVDTAKDTMSADQWLKYFWNAQCLASSGFKHIIRPDTHSRHDLNRTAKIDRGDRSNRADRVSIWCLWS